MRPPPNTHHHAEILALLAAAGTALERLEEERDSEDPADAPMQRHYHLRDLRRRWDPFCESVRFHLEQEARVLPLLEQRVEAREVRATEVLSLLQQVSRQHEQLHLLAGEVRQASIGIDPMRRPLDLALAAVFKHAEWEDTRVLPGLARAVGARFCCVSQARYTDDAGLTRQLRSAVQVPVEPGPRRRGLLSLLPGLVRLSGSTSAY